MLLAGEGGDSPGGLGPDGPVRVRTSRSLHRELRLLLLRLREEGKGRPRPAVLLLRHGRARESKSQRRTLSVGNVHVVDDNAGRGGSNVALRVRFGSNFKLSAGPSCSSSGPC